MALCALALATTGCQLRLRVDVDVNRNGGGTLAVVVGADPELLAAAEEAGADPLAELAAAGEELGEGWRVRQETDGTGWRTVTLSTAFDDPQELAVLSRSLSESLNGPEAKLLEPLAVGVTDAEVRVHGIAAARPGRAVRDYGLSPKAAVRRIKRAEALDYQVRVTLPGSVLSSSANAPPPPATQELVWQVEPGDRVVIDAVGERPGPPILRAVAGAAAGAVLAGVVLWLVARRRRSA